MYSATWDLVGMTLEKSVPAVAVASQQIWDRAPKEIWAYLFILGGIYLLYILRNYIRCVSFVRTLDGPLTVPILGNMNVVLENALLQKMSHEAQNYGRIFRVWVSWLPYVVFTEPEDIQAILGSARHTEKIFIYKLLDNFLGKGLITRDVESWRFHRKILQPAFHVHVLERFTTSFGECSEHLVRKFVAADGRDVNITSFINDSVYDILNETVLGITPESRRSNQNVDDEMPFRKGQVMITHRLVRPWLLIDWIYRLTKAGKQEEKQRRELFKACFKMIKERRKLREKSSSEESAGLRKVSLLEYMLEINERNPCFDEEAIVEECCTFMLAGQDSVGTATAMTLFLLANHAEWQEKCAEELEEIFRGDDRSPTMKDLREMRCVEMCVREALRLYPSVPIFARCLREDVKIGKHVIPTGCGVFFMPYSTHRLPHHFPDPHAFKPERFSPENSENRHPYAYLPFSAGPRNCIGYKFAMLEMKSMISGILRSCKLHPVPGKTEVRPMFRMTVRARGGLWVKVVARDKLK